MGTRPRECLACSLVIARAPSTAEVVMAANLTLDTWESTASTRALVRASPEAMAAVLALSAAHQDDQ